MKRAMVTSGTLVLALVAILAPAAHARPAQARPSVICPLVGIAPAATPPCCGPIAAVQAAATPCCTAGATVPCCEPVAGSTCCSGAPCPVAITIDVTPNPASEGSEATIAGALSGTGPLGAQTVVLWERAAGDAGFRDVAQTESTAAGAYSFTEKVTTNTQWYVEAESVVSSTVTESVRAAVVLLASSGGPTAGTTIRLSGTVAPSHAGERVDLQRLRSGRWVTVARPMLGAGSRFEVTEMMARVAGSRERFRVMLAADARNARSVSKAIAVP